MLARLRTRVILALFALAVGAFLGYAESGRDDSRRDLGSEQVPRPVMIELGSNACASCRAMQDVVAELRRAHPAELEVRQFDVLRERALLAGWRVKAIPTQVFQDAQGRELERHVGFISADGVRTTFDRHGIVLGNGHAR